MSKQTNLEMEPAYVIVADKGPNGSNAMRCAEVVEWKGDEDKRELVCNVWNAGERRFSRKTLPQAAVGGVPDPSDKRLDAMRAKRAEERAEAERLKRERAEEKKRNGVRA